MTKIISINKQSEDYFQANWSRVFSKEDMKIVGLRNLEGIKETKHADDLRYYPFTWGVIIERRMELSVIWDVCLYQVNKVKNALTIEQVKKHIFVILEKLIPEYTDEEPIYFNAMKRKWVVYPGATFSEITVAFKVENEDAARQWMGEVMIAKILDQVQQALYIPQDSQKSPLTA
mgnify:FL=1|jgi:hypothetical protein